MLVAAAAILWSTAGLLVRLLDPDVWTILAWRSVFAALSLALLVLIQNGRETFESVWIRPVDSMRTRRRCRVPAIRGSMRVPCSQRRPGQGITGSRLGARIGCPGA